MPQSKCSVKGVNALLNQARVLWCDAEANLDRLANLKSVRRIVESAKRAKVNTIVVDVKPLIGEVLYHSSVAPRLTGIKGFAYPSDFDLLEAMISEGHSKDIKVHANINVFSEGHRQFSQGPGFDHPHWQVVSHEGLWKISIGSALFEASSVDILCTGDPVSIYTSKTADVSSGKSRAFVTVSRDLVCSVSLKYAPCDADGCVIAIPEGLAREITTGDRVSFKATTLLRRMSESRLPSYGLFVNPIGPAREYELAVIGEIMSGYPVDGILFDRMRYPNLHADFSDLSRERFAAWLGDSCLRWPDDVFRINDRPWLPVLQGKYYREWLEWRAQQIKDFLSDAARLCRSIRPDAKVSAYVGSWYQHYFNEGVNWASETYHAGTPWMTPAYNRTGYAELLDFLCTGCYYPIATIDQARRLGRLEGATVEAACKQSRAVVNGACPVYGSLYVKDYEGDPQAFESAVRAAVSHSDGVMLFDLVYIEQYGWWPLVERLFDGEAIAPHDGGC